MSPTKQTTVARNQKLTFPEPKIVGWEAVHLANKPDLQWGLNHLFYNCKSLQWFSCTRGNNILMSKRAQLWIFTFKNCTSDKSAPGSQQNTSAGPQGRECQQRQLEL